LEPYLSSYHHLDPTIVWDIGTSLSSDEIWDKFAANPDNHLGIFTMFGGKEEKLKRFNEDRYLTSAFAHVAVAIIYRVDSMPDQIHLQVTPDILGRIFSGSIIWYHDSYIHIYKDI
jgi:hypothetical protein